MSETIKAIYEGGIFRPIDPLALEEHQQVYLVLVPESLDSLVASQRKALEELEGIGRSGRSDIRESHDSFLYTKG